MSVGGILHFGQYGTAYGSVLEGSKGTVKVTPSITALVDWSNAKQPVAFGGVSIVPGLPDKEVGSGRPAGFDKKYLQFNMEQLFPIDLR